MSARIAPIYAKMILNACEDILVFHVPGAEQLRKNLRECLNRRGYYHDAIKLSSSSGRLVAFKKGM